MDKDVEAWATTILLAADAHQSQVAGTAAFSAVLAADEDEIREQVKSHKDDNAICATVCSTLASSPQLAAHFASSRGIEWNFPLKTLATITSSHANGAGVPWDVSQRIIKLTEIVLQGVRAVASEINSAIESVGPKKGVWKVNLFGRPWKVPGTWDRRPEVAELFSSDGKTTREQLRCISERVERAFVASEVAFETLVELEGLVKMWTSFNIYLNVRLALVKIILAIFDEGNRLAQFMRTEKADCFIEGIVEVALSMTAKANDPNKVSMPVEGLKALGLMLECADDFDDHDHTRRGELMMQTIKRLSRGIDSCSGRILYEKLALAVKDSNDAIDPLLIICSHACEDYGVHNRFSKLQLQQIIPKCDNPECNGCGADENALLQRFTRHGLNHLKCENPTCGKRLKRFPRCTKCLHAFYCGRECQIEHHPIHKLECSSLKKCARCHDQ